jgi:acetolactate synthase-1/2/3 large subunit
MAALADSLLNWRSCCQPPVVPTIPGKSAMPEDHPLALGASTRSQPKMFTEFMRRLARCKIL